MIDFDIENELQPVLNKDEKLLWTGRPKTGIVFRSFDIFLIPFSLLWCGFAIFWTTGVFSSNAPFFFKLFGIPFVVFGLYFVFGRFFFEARRRRGTVYGITANRVIIKSRALSQEIKSLNIKTLSDLTLSEKKDRTGTISLGPTDYRAAFMGGMDWPGVKQAPRLEFIDNAKEVYDLLVKLQRQ